MAQIDATNTNIEYFDGFEDYNTSQIARYWTTANNAFSGLTIAVSGRNSGSALSCGAPGDWVSITLTSQSTRTIGFAFRLNGALNNIGLPFAIVQLQDVSTPQVDVRINIDGTLFVTRNGTTLGTTSFSIVTATWYYIEFSSVINNTTGSYDLHVNGVSRLSGSGANTRASANNSANVVVLGTLSGSNSPNMLFDDYYIRSDSTFLGDCRVESKLPTGNGLTNNWLRGGTDSGNNWDQVNENPANDDTDYNYSGTATDIDLYTYPTLSTTAGTVFAVMTVPIMKVDTAGVATATPIIRSGGTNYPGVTKNIGATTYGAYMDIQGKDPNGPIAWTVSSVNSAQYGIERLS